MHGVSILCYCDRCYWGGIIMSAGPSFVDDILSEVKHFAAFFRSLWGLFAGGSILFPFFNTVVEAIPYPEPRVKAPSAALATLGSVLAFLVVYLVRHGLRRIDQPGWGTLSWGLRRRRMPFPGHRSTLLAGLNALAFAWLTYRYLQAVLGGAYLAPERAIFWYAAMFSLATSTFAILGGAEYMRQVGARESRRGRYQKTISEAARQNLWDSLPRDTRPPWSGDLAHVSQIWKKEDNVMVLVMTIRSPSTGDLHEIEMEEDGYIRYMGSPRREAHG